MKPVLWYHPVSQRVRYDGAGLGSSWIPLYRKHEWVGLTMQQIQNEWERVTGHSIFGGDRGRSMFLSPDEVVHYTQSIEAKLKEKNT